MTLEGNLSEHPLFAGLQTRDERTNTDEPNDPRYVLICPNCANRWTRERDSKLVKQARNNDCWCSECGQENGTLQVVIDAKYGITPDVALTQIHSDITHQSGHKATVYTDELGYVEAGIWDAEHADKYHRLLLHPNDSEIREQIGGMYMEILVRQNSDTGEWSFRCELEREILNDDLDVVDREFRENELLGIEITK